MSMLEPTGCFADDVSFEDTVAAMRTLWGVKGGDQTIIGMIQERKQGAQEPITAYAAAFQRLVGLLSPALAKVDTWLPIFRANLAEANKIFLIGKSDLNTLPKNC